MKNAEKYLFEDFTIEHYDEILKEVKKHHEVISFSEAKDSERLGCILRHDIDFSVENSVRMAEVEIENDVKSTYYVHLHSEFYNALEKDNSTGIKKIRDFGHDIGIHFDVHQQDISTEEELIERLSFEKKMFANYFDVDVTSFSFHNTNEWILNQKEFSYAGLINAYSSFFTDNFAYCSDSNGHWRFDRMIDFVRANKENNIQILTHPLWWGSEESSPRQKIKNHLNREGNRVYSKYADTLKAGGRLNIDFDESLISCPNCSGRSDPKLEWLLVCPPIS